MTDTDAFIAGSVGGFVVKLVDYPFDTIKVLLQTEKQNHKFVPYVTNVIKKHSLYGLYRGLSIPLFLSTVDNCVVFGTYAKTQKELEKHRPSYSRSIKTLCGGAMAGFISSIILTPCELIKCRMQTTLNSSTQYSNIKDCFTKTYHIGGISALYVGHKAMMCREMVGNSVYFATYEQFVGKKPKSGTSLLKIGLAGSLAGLAYWTCIYPIDTIKSIKQTQTNLSYPTIARNVLKNKGVLGFYGGYPINAFKTVFSNFIMFTTYEFMMELSRK